MISLNTFQLGLEVAFLMAPYVAVSSYTLLGNTLDPWPAKLYLPVVSI